MTSPIVRALARIRVFTIYFCNEYGCAAVVRGRGHTSPRLSMRVAVENRLRNHQ